MAWVWKPATTSAMVDTSAPVEWKGTYTDYNGVTYEMYPVGCCEHGEGRIGWSSCCANGLMCFLTWGTCLCVPPKFTITINEDGKSGVGKDATFCFCLPMSPIPCCNGCGFGPCAFVSPFKIEDVEGGAQKWVGNGSICAGGCCPCINNFGDYGISSVKLDGSARNRAHEIYPVSMFWPPCVNGVCCGKSKPSFRMTQKGVGKPTKNDYEPPAIDVDEAPASSEMVDRAPDDENDSCAPSGGIFCASDGKEDPEV